MAVNQSEGDSWRTRVVYVAINSWQLYYKWYILQGVVQSTWLIQTAIHIAYPWNWRLVTYIATYIPHSSLRSECCIESKAYFLCSFTKCKKGYHWMLTPVAEPSRWPQSLLTTSLVMVHWYSCSGSHGYLILVISFWSFYICFVERLCKHY